MKRLDQEDAVYLNGYVPLVYDDEFGFSDEEYTQRDSLITGFDFNSFDHQPKDGVVPVDCRQKMERRREEVLDGDDLEFEFMIGFRMFTAYLDPFLPMNIISRKAYNKIMVKGLERTGKNLVAIIKDVYVFVGSFTYITEFVVLEDIGEFIMSDMDEVLMGRPFRKITKLKYDVVKGLISFTKIFDTYTYRMTDSPGLTP
ncbi:hypothetical protein Tco_0672951 [Tanacetum coccineum]